jgi:hypothetical protein
MDIADFDEITGLYAYWSSSESVIDSTGSDINSVTGVAGKGSNPEAVLAPRGDKPTLTDTVGAMPGLSTDNASTTQGLSHNLLATSAEVTILWTEKRLNTGSGGTSLNARRSGSGTHTEIDRFGSDLRANTNSGPLVTTIPISLNPTVVCLRSGSGVDDSDISFSVDGGATSTFALPHTEDRTMVEFGFMNFVGGTVTDSMRGSMSLMVVYLRKLTDQERDDAIELANYWVANNEAPSVGPGPSATFGPVSTNDDPSVTGWQWEESPNGADWENVGTILSDVSGATTQTLTVNSAPIEADQTRVRCRAFSANEPTGVVSHSAILTVQV